MVMPIVIAAVALPGDTLKPQRYVNWLVAAGSEAVAPAVVPGAAVDTCVDPGG